MKNVKILRKSTVWGEFLPPLMWREFLLRKLFAHILWKELLPLINVENFTSTNQERLRAFNIFQVYKYFTIYRRYFFLNPQYWG
jgi:hypothetical protein